MATALRASESVLSGLQVNPVCIGDGVDAQSLGLLSVVVVPTVIGLILWVSCYFASVKRCFLCSRENRFYSLLYAHVSVKSMQQENGLSNKSACPPRGPKRES